MIALFGVVFIVVGAINVADGQSKGDSTQKALGFIVGIIGILMFGGEVLWHGV